MTKSNKAIPRHLNDFLDYLDIEKGLSNISQKNYHRFLNKFLHWLELTNNQELKPHELNPQYIWDYKLYLSRFKDPKTKKYLKKTTQSYYLIVLRALLDYFSDKDIEAMPSSKVKLPKLSKERVPKFLNLDQIEKLLLQPDTSNKIGLRDKVILEVLFSTGMRVAELTTLNRDLFSNLKNINDLEITIIGKGERPRTVYFSQRAISWLKKYLETRNDTDKALFIRYGGTKNEAKRLSIRSVEKNVKKYAQLSGLPIITTPHTLRHSYATDLLSQGVDLRAVQEFLGHSNILTTQIYTHITNKRLRDIHKKYHSGNRLKDN
jgi:site-specific recombinase XerD